MATSPNPGGDNDNVHRNQDETAMTSSVTGSRSPPTVEECQARLNSLLKSAMDARRYEALEFQTRLLRVTSVAVLLLAVLCMLVAGFTDDWTIITVDRQKLLEGQALAFDDNPGINPVNDSAHDTRLYNRSVGLLRVCHDAGTSGRFPFHKDLRVDFFNRDYLCRHLPYYTEMFTCFFSHSMPMTGVAVNWFHVTRSVYGGLIFYLFLLALALVLQIVGFFYPNQYRPYSTAGGFSLAAGILAFASLILYGLSKYYERFWVEDVSLGFAPTWPPYVQDATSYRHGWSYFMALSGAILALANCMLCSWAAVNLRRLGLEECRKLRERKVRRTMQRRAVVALERERLAMVAAMALPPTLHIPNSNHTSSSEHTPRSLDSLDGGAASTLPRTPIPLASIPAGLPGSGLIPSARHRQSILNGPLSVSNWDSDESTPTERARMRERHRVEVAAAREGERTQLAVAVENLRALGGGIPSADEARGAVGFPPELYARMEERERRETTPPSLATLAFRASNWHAHVPPPKPPLMYSSPNKPAGRETGAIPKDTHILFGTRKTDDVSGSTSAAITSPPSRGATRSGSTSVDMDPVTPDDTHRNVGSAYAVINVSPENASRPAVACGITPIIGLRPRTESYETAVFSHGRVPKSPPPFNGPSSPVRMPRPRIGSTPSSAPATPTTTPGRSGAYDSVINQLVKETKM